LVLLEDRILPSGTTPLASQVLPIHLPRKIDASISSKPSPIIVSSELAAPVTQQVARTKSPPLTGTPATVTTGTAFPGVSLQDLYDQGGGITPPDTMGVVGPSQFVEMINGQFAVFSKTGTLITSESMDSFWSAVSPVGGTTDPHLFYDQHSGRWFASTIDVNDGLKNNHLLIACSKTSDPTGAWNMYKILAGSSTEFADYDTLGVDSNGVYFGASIFTTTGGGNVVIFATPKAPLLSGSTITVTKFDGITDMFSSPQPADNFDTVAASGPAWFVSSSAAVTANVAYRTLTWSGTTPILSATHTVVTPAYGNVLQAPSLGATQALDTGDDRLLMAVIRNKQLWTARTAGVNSSGTDAGADRDGAEFVNLNVATTSASLIQSGRLLDPSASNPRFYFYPSLAVNSQGYMAMGFSGSKTTEFIGAYATGRLASDPLGKLQPVTLLKGGQGAYTITFGAGRNRWGDYSYTSLDPTDNKTIWTIQEFADPTVGGKSAGDATSRWGTWIDQIKAPLINTATSVASSPRPSVFGQMVTFTASVLPSTGSGTPTGKVSFLQGTTLLGQSTVVGGKATLGMSALTVGNHTITAKYLGDSNFNISSGTDAAAPQVVQKAHTHTGLSSSANPSVLGHPVTFTARVRVILPGAGVPTGTVTFEDTFNGTTKTLGSGTVNSQGLATFSTSTLAVGSHAITAVYGGDAHFLTSTAAAFGQTVNALSAAATSDFTSAMPALADLGSFASSEGIAGPRSRRHDWLPVVF
jgi:hypothetical protein